MKEEKSKYSIYKAENLINGQVYIGATTYSIVQRKLDHIERANRKEINKFHEAISTYGADAFSWEQIDTATTTDELAQKEKAYVIQYDSKANGYNSDAGGGFKKTVYQYSIGDGAIVNEYDCLESAANAVSADKKQISKVCLSVNKVFKGYYWSYDYIEPFQTDIDQRKKEVLQYTLDGHLLAKYISISEAARQTNCNKGSIAKVSRGERNQAGGFLWKYN